LDLQRNDAKLDGFLFDKQKEKNPLKIRKNVSILSMCLMGCAFLLIGGGVGCLIVWALTQATKNADFPNM
jgi:hypothetical protein